MKITNNVSPPRKVEIHLDHKTYCGDGACSCTPIVQPNTQVVKGYVMGIKKTVIKVPGVLTILSGETVDKLPDGSEINSNITKTPDFIGLRSSLKVEV